MEYLNLIAMEDLLLKLIVCLIYCFFILVALYGVSLLAEKILKFKNRAVKTAPRSK